MKKTHHAGAPWRNFYGRTKGKSLRDSQKIYLEEDLEKLAPSGVTWDENPDRNKVDLADWFPDAQEVWLEIGFGGGEHMAHQAKTYPNVGIVGCEPYVNGVAMAFGNIRKVGARNVKVHAGDARDMLDVIPVGGIQKAFLLYPDPWPKARHHRRRFVTAEHLEPLAEALAPGAEFRIATDIEDYVRQALEEVLKTGLFDWTAQTAEDWKTPWADWYSTRYEQKALREGRVPHYLTFIKR